MYTKPELQKFGTMRDLTMAGLSGDTDGFQVWGITAPGCEIGPFEIGCPRS